MDLLVHPAFMAILFYILIEFMPILQDKSDLHIYSTTDTSPSHQSFQSETLSKRDFIFLRLVRVEDK